MKNLNKTIGSLALLAGIALPAAEAQITTTGSFDLTLGTDDATSFVLNEVSNQQADGSVITGTFDNFKGRNTNSDVGDSSPGLTFDDSAGDGTHSNTYSFDLTFSSNITDIVITGYTVGNSQSVFSDLTETLTIAWDGDSVSGLKLSELGSQGGPTYSTSIAIVGNVLTWSESSGGASAGGEASIRAITFDAVAVPEPSTYVLLTGLFVLGGVMIRRKLRA